jgi:hypothetical protein
LVAKPSWRSWDSMARAALYMNWKSLLVMIRMGEPS